MIWAIWCPYLYAFLLAQVRFPRVHSSSPYPDNEDLTAKLGEPSGENLLCIYSPSLRQTSCLHLCLAFPAQAPWSPHLLFSPPHQPNIYGSSHQLLSLWASELEEVALSFLIGQFRVPLSWVYYTSCHSSIYLSASKMLRAFDSSSICSIFINIWHISAVIVEY